MRPGAPTQNLAWLLGCLDNASRALRWIGSDVDALVIEAHRAALARGEEWYGDPIVSPTEVDGSIDLKPVPASPFPQPALESVEKGLFSDPEIPSRPAE